MKGRWIMKILINLSDNGWKRIFKIKHCIVDICNKNSLSLILKLLTSSFFANFWIVFTLLIWISILNLCFCNFCFYFLKARPDPQCSSIAVQLYSQTFQMAVLVISLFFNQNLKIKYYIIQDVHPLIKNAYK